MTDRWWWSLTEHRVVGDDQRGPDHEVLGPYPTQEAARAWRETVEVRNDAWKAEDERWAGEPPDAEAADDGPPDPPDSE